MMVLSAVARAQRFLSGYGLAAALALAAALWPEHSDELLVGAGILMGLSMAVRRGSRAHGRERVLHASPMDEFPTHDRVVARRTEAKLPHRHRVGRNELTGELLERSRVRMTTSPGRPRVRRGSLARSSMADKRLAGAASAR